MLDETNSRTKRRGLETLIFTQVIDPWPLDEDEVFAGSECMAINDSRRDALRGETGAQAYNCEFTEVDIFGRKRRPTD